MPNEVSLIKAFPDRNNESTQESASIWSKPLDAKEEKSKEEEYEDYFTDLLQ